MLFFVFGFFFAEVVCRVTLLPQRCCHNALRLLLLLLLLRLLLLRRGRRAPARASASCVGWQWEWQSRVFVMSVRGTRHVPLPSLLSFLLAHSRRAPLCRYLASTRRTSGKRRNTNPQTRHPNHQTPNTKHQTPTTKHQLIPSVHPVQDCTGLCCWGRRSLSLVFVVAAGGHRQCLWCSLVRCFPVEFASLFAAFAA